MSNKYFVRQFGKKDVVELHVSDAETARKLAKSQAEANKTRVYWGWVCGCANRTTCGHGMDDHYFEFSKDWNCVTEFTCNE